MKEKMLVCPQKSDSLQIFIVSLHPNCEKAEHL